MDDDGERMLACEVCGTWMHSRCIGLNDDEDVAEKFSDGFCCSVCFMDDRTGPGSIVSASTLGPAHSGSKTEVSSVSDVPSSSARPDSPGDSSSAGSLGGLEMDATGGFADGELWG